MSNKIARNPWLLSAAVIISTLALAGVIIFAVYQVGKNRDQTKHDVASNAKRLAENSKLLEHEIDQVRYSAYIFCRSEGRTPHACKKIARLVILPRELNVPTLKTALAKIGEAQIDKLFVGKPGSRGRVGTKGIPGIPGVKGPRGNRGERGASGSQGANGQRGVAGARGAAGPQGAQGQAGPAGPPGPQGPAGAAFNCAAVGGRGPFWILIPRLGQDFNMIYACVK